MIATVASANSLVDGIRRGKEIQVAVEIGNPVGVRFAFPDMQHPGRRTGEVIFDDASRRSGRGKLGIGGFEILQPHRHQSRQIERDQNPVTGLAQAQHPQPRVRRVPLQRMIERQSARQVVVVEIGAVDAVRHDPCVSQAAERTGGGGGLGKAPTCPVYKSRQNAAMRPWQIVDIWRLTGKFPSPRHGPPTASAASPAARGTRPACSHRKRFELRGAAC